MIKCLGVSARTRTRLLSSSPRSGDQPTPALLSRSSAPPTTHPNTPPDARHDQDVRDEWAHREGRPIRIVQWRYVLRRASSQMQSPDQDFRYMRRFSAHILALNLDLLGIWV